MITVLLLTTFDDAFQPDLEPARTVDRILRFPQLADHQDFGFGQHQCPGHAALNRKNAKTDFLHAVKLASWPTK